MVVTKKYLELLKNIVILGLGLLGSKFVQFVLLPYFTNTLTTAEYGTIDLVITFVGLMVPIVTLELSDSVLRFGLSKEINKVDLIKCSLFLLTLGAIFTIVISPIFFLYKTIWPYKNWIVLMIIFQSFRTNAALFVKSQDKVLIYALDSILTALITAVLDVFLISILKIGIKGYFIAELMGYFVSFLFLFLAGGIYRWCVWRQPLNRQLLRQMLRYSIPLMFNAISWWITSFSDRAILNIFFSESEVGLYSVAAKIPAIITTLLSVFTQAWIMSAVKEYEKDNNSYFFERIYKIYNSVLFLGVGITLLIIKPIMKVYVGKGFYDSWYYIPILLLGTVFLGISNYYGAIYAAAKANILEVKSTLICAFSNIILNFIFIPKLSILGAVLATAISYVIVVFVRMIDTKKIIVIKIGRVDLCASCIFLIGEIYFLMSNRDIIMLVPFIGLAIWKVGILIYENYHKKK